MVPDDLGTASPMSRSESGREGATITRNFVAASFANPSGEKVCVVKGCRSRISTLNSLLFPEVEEVRVRGQQTNMFIAAFDGTRLGA